MENPRLIGHIVSVQGFRVKVELLPETRSPMRATADGVRAAVAINAYLSFPLGAGEVVIGVITDLEARETFDPMGQDELRLELVKPRRVANVQLLGSVTMASGTASFVPGITVLPTLDAPAEIGTPEVLRAVFEIPPRHNRPIDCADENFDCELRLGKPTGQPNSVVRASYNDLFSRPMAVVGNTGSGKSYTVSSLIQKAMRALDGAMVEPHVFILDINGEYANAFSSVAKTERQPDRIYLNGKEFGVPIWFFNAEEVCAWLSAAEQTQEPVLKDWWAIAKAGAEKTIAPSYRLQNALSALDNLTASLSKLQRKAAPSYCDAVLGHLEGSDIDTTALDAKFEDHRKIVGFNQEVVQNQAEIAEVCEDLKEQVRKKIVEAADEAEITARTADSPLRIERESLANPSLLNRSVTKEDASKIESHLTTLKLRLKTRLDDRRWRAFLNYEAKETKTNTAEEWFESFGLGKTGGPAVSVVDLSMLSSEVLPYACAILGRMLLDARECLPAESRYRHPWVLVLEEAHNYARPPRSDEDRGHKLARLAYERIAKEGRKFGLSLIIASQRPSEISATIISQCANFISHRLQNPDDIEHFRRIIPIQARRLLDQVTILASGEAIVFGSAFHIPTRVQIDRAEPGPHSQTAAPYWEWKSETAPFPLAQVIESWGLEDKAKKPATKSGKKK